MSHYVDQAAQAAIVQLANQDQIAQAQEFRAKQAAEQERQQRQLALDAENQRRMQQQQR